MKRFWLAATTLLGLAAFTTSVQAAQKPTLNYDAMRKLGWRLSCQAYTFREMSLFETLDTISAMGVRYVELYPGQRFSPEKPNAKVGHDMSPELISELKEKLKAVNVRPMNYGVVGFGNDEQSARKVFEWAKTMGIQTINTEPAEAMVPMLDKLAQEYGINVAMHNHPKPSRYWHPDTVLKVSEGRSPRIGACADTGHWYRSDLTPVDQLKKLKGRIITFHFKDLGPAKHDVPWGTGNCNARAMLEEMKQQGFRGVFSIEYEHGSGPELRENVRKCVEWFSAQAADLAK